MIRYEQWGDNAQNLRINPEEPSLMAGQAKPALQEFKKVKKSTGEH
jgi:hypothetical protein